MRGEQMRRPGTVRAATAALVVGLVVLMGMSTAGAQTYPGEATLTLSQPTVPQGGSFSATMTGCAPGESIRFVLTSDPIEMGTVVAGPTGTGTVVFTVPTDYQTGPHTVTSTCGTQVLTANIEVLARAVTPSTRPSSTPLPVTGSDTDLFVRAGVSLVAVGGLLVVAAFAARRRNGSAA